MKRGERKLWRDLAEACYKVADSKNYGEEYIARIEIKNITLAITKIKGW